MRKPFCLTTLCGCLAVVLMAGAAWAQPPGGRGGNTGLTDLLNIDKVQEELKLTEDQIAEVSAMVDEVRSMLSEKFEAEFGADFDPQEMTDEDRERMRDVMREARNEIRTWEKEKLGQLLNEDQRTRLQQISWQAQGGRALSDADLQTALGLSDDQKTQITKLFDDLQTQSMEAFRSGDREAAGRLRTEAYEAAMALLTDEQKTKLEELKGEPFELPQREGRNGGRSRNDF
jgi:Spy/CpxP family protein refolding chaperone